MKFSIILITSAIALPSYAETSATNSVMEAQNVSGLSQLSGFYSTLSASSGTLGASFVQEGIVDGYENGVLDLDTAQGLFGAIGYDYGNGLRIEGELFGLQADTGRLSFPDAVAPYDHAHTTGTLKTSGGMLNAWYGFGDGAVRPFIGGGIGAMTAEIDTEFELGSNNGISGSDSAMVWQLGFGAEIPMSDKLSLVASYRRMQADNLNFVDNEDTPITADFKADIATVGVMFRF